MTADIVVAIVALFALLTGAFFLGRASVRVHKLVVAGKAVPPIRQEVVLTLLQDAIREAAAEHDAYEKDRVEVRKRLGFDPGQRTTAIAQRAQRKLAWAQVKVHEQHVKEILKGGK